MNQDHIRHDVCQDRATSRKVFWTVLIWIPLLVLAPIAFVTFMVRTFEMLSSIISASSFISDLYGIMVDTVLGSFILCATLLVLFIKTSAYLIKNL